MSSQLILQFNRAAAASGAIAPKAKINRFGFALSRVEI